MLPKKVIGVEQIEDRQVEHKVVDYRPLLALAVFTLFTIAALITTGVTK